MPNSIKCAAGRDHDGKRRENLAVRGDPQGTCLTQGCLGKCFSEFGCQNTQGFLQPWSKGASLLLKLEAELPIIYVVLNFRNAVFKSDGVTETSKQILGEGTGGQEKL